MRYDKNEKAIKEALKTIKTPEHDFTQEVKSKISATSLAQPYKAATGRYKKARFILIAGMVGLLSITVLGSTVTSFNRLLAIISPEIAALLRPAKIIEASSERDDDEAVNHVQESNNIGENSSNVAMNKAEGIEVKPLAAVNDNEMLLVYLTMQDLTEDRLDETVSIYDYFVEGTTINNCQVIDYDAATKTAILCLKGNGGKKLKASNIQIDIKSFLTHKKTFEGVATNIDLSQIPKVSQDATTNLYHDQTSGGGGTGELWNEMEEQGYVEVLKAANQEITVPGIEAMKISNIGFINNKLHIQTKWDEENIDSHGDFYLADQKGNKVEVVENNIYFGVDEKHNTQYGSNYVEYILDISPEKIKGLKLMGNFVEWDALVEGDWQVDVDLTSGLQTINVPCDLQMENWHMEEAEISPLGITLIGKGKFNKQEGFKASIKLKNGEVKKFDNIMTSNQFGEVTMKLGVEIPLDMDEITAIEINEHVIQVN